MLEWLRSLLMPAFPKPAGPPELVRAVPIDEPPLARDGVTRDGDAWRLRAEAPGHVRLYDVELPGLEQCILTYRLHLTAGAERCPNLGHGHPHRLPE